MKDSQFFNYFIGIIGALTAFLVIMIILANVIAKSDKAQDKMVTESIKDNIAPVGQVATSDAAASAASSGSTSAAADPKASYQSACFACHGTGAAGAPKLGDKAAWKARIAQGKATLYKHAISGKGAMPPKGGSSLGDDAVKAVVDYMITQSK